MNHDLEVEQARLLSPVEDTDNVSLDSSLATAQFEAIIRAWKGEVIEGDIPDSPVGEVDWDGSRAIGLSNGPLMSWTISFACSYLICVPDTDNCGTVPNDCTHPCG